MRSLIVLVLSATAWAQGEGHRQANETTLGLVVFEERGKVVVAEALPRSPAAKGGVKRGDVIYRVGPRDVKRHNDIDLALRKWPKEKKIELDLLRDGKKLHVMVKPALRTGFPHPYLRPAANKPTGYPAPAWHAFGWVNVGRNPPPTRANTKGKVVVIHCFQSW